MNEKEVRPTQAKSIHVWISQTDILNMGQNIHNIPMFYNSVLYKCDALRRYAHFHVVKYWFYYYNCDRIVILTPTAHNVCTYIICFLSMNRYQCKYPSFDRCKHIIYIYIIMYIYYYVYIYILLCIYYYVYIYVKFYI